MFSAIYSYLFLPRRWQQWTVFLSAIPLIVVGNVVRILLLVLGCILLGTAFALGTNDNPSSYHEGCGVAVFIVVLGLEWLLAYFLVTFEQRQPKGAAPAVPLEQEPSSPATDENIRLGDVPQWRTWVMLGLAAIMLGVLEISPARYLAPEAGVVMSLPDEVVIPGLKAVDDLSGSTFYGTPAAVSEAELTILPKDTEFARKNYDDLHGHNIFFSIVLSGLQQYTIHPPEVCLVAQGWIIGKQEDITIHLASGHDLVARCLHIQGDTSNDDSQKPPIQALYLYWYVTDTLATPSHVVRNLWSSWERIGHNRDHRWAYITVMSPITRSVLPDGLDEGQTLQMLTEFIVQTAPLVQKSELPGLNH
jgi:exosortase/archaeosortase family protein